MEALFLQILNMSMSASLLIIVVIVIRFLLKKAPKGFRYVLWALVAVRLLCPTFIQSDFSLVPSLDVIADVAGAVKPIKPDVPEGDSGTIDNIMQDNIQNDDISNHMPGNNDGQNNAVQNDIILDQNQEENDEQRDAIQDSAVTEMTRPITVITWIWAYGFLFLLTYAVVSYGQLRKMIKVSIKKEDNLWICDGIQSPFILGMICPRIYLPSYIEEHHLPYIVAHEKEHIRCKDNWWKLLGFVLLLVHWFNPLVWISYILMCRDIEMACDERVIRSMGSEDKKNYSKSLLLCSNPRHFISVCPVAFGEVGVKERIKKIVDYRKPSVWIVGIAAVLCLIIICGFMTNPKKDFKEVSKIWLRSPGYSKGLEITDEETIKHITDELKDLSLIPIGPNPVQEPEKPEFLTWFAWILMKEKEFHEITWYDVDGNEIDSFWVIGDDKIMKKYFIYMSLNRQFDSEYYRELLAKDCYEKTEADMLFEDAGGLSKDKMEWFSTQFFNNDDNRITNAFLASTYSAAKDINLHYLFYTGPDGYGGGSVSEEEKRLLGQNDSYAQEFVHYLDISKTTTQEMDYMLQKYTGLSLEESNKVNLDQHYYLEGYDAYYNIAGDTVLTKYKFVKGWEEENGDIRLQYYDALSGDESEQYLVTLKLVNGSYCFVSNVKAIENGQKVKYDFANFTVEDAMNFVAQEGIEDENWFKGLVGYEEMVLEIIQSTYESPDYIPMYEYEEMQSFASKIVKRVRAYMDADA